MKLETKHSTEIRTPQESGSMEAKLISLSTLRIMGNDQLIPHRPYVTEFNYDLRERGDELTDEEFEKVSMAVHEWGTKADVPVEIRKNKKGFSVAITHPLENGDGFGMSLFLHLSAGIFREIEKQDQQ